MAISILKQGVALTDVILLARHRVLPPGELRCIILRRGVSQTTTDDDRRHRAKQYCPPYTMCRRASSNVLETTLKPTSVGQSLCDGTNKILRFVH